MGRATVALGAALATRGAELAAGAALDDASAKGRAALDDEGMDVGATEGSAPEGCAEPALDGPLLSPVAK